MIVETVTWIIFSLAVATIALIIGRKLSVIRAIDVTLQPGERARSVKARLLEHRLERKVAGFGQSLGRYLRPFWKGLKESVSRLYHAVSELNKRYERQLKELQQASHAPTDQVGKVRQLLTEADTFISSQSWSEAEQRLIEVIGLEPKNIDAYRRLGDLYLEQKNYEDARQTFEHLIRLNQADDVAYAGLAHVAEAEGRLGDARDEYVHSIKLNDAVAQHHLDLSKVALAMNVPDDAIRAAKAAVRLEPNNPKMLSGLLDAYVQAKDAVGAKSILERLREVNPENQRLEDWQTQIDKL